MKSANPKKRTGYIVSHTHWDREWRFAIWGNRLMLVDFLDELLGLIESGQYPGYLLDGQVIPVLDYLEMRPEKEHLVKKLVSTGKLEIGPWYTLPDEYPVDGECLIRNLLTGIRKAKTFGEPLMVGYTSFGWGQTAQLPQIYAGFGISVAMIGKRVSSQRAPQSEFVWRAPDGSELLATRFGAWGRQNFYLPLHLTILFGTDHFGPGWEYKWENGGIAFHRADAMEYEDDYNRLDAPTKWYPEALTQELIDRTWDTTRDSVLENDRLMMDGCDHYSAGQPMLPEMIAKLNQIDKASDRQWVHVRLSDFIKIMESKIDRSGLKIVEGELRDGPAKAMTGNALSTRLYLKRLNKKAQNDLIRFAEPLASLTRMVGGPDNSKFLNKAWDYLLKSQPHDSINGVTRDKTVDDVEYRLNQVCEISKTVGNRSLEEMVKSIDLSAFNDNDVLIVAFNPLPYPRSEVVEAWIDTPDDLPDDQNWSMMSDGLLISDAHGKSLGTQWSGFERLTTVVFEIHTRGFPFKCRRHRVFFETGVIPAGGYKIFKAGAFDAKRGDGTKFSDMLSRTDSLLKTPNVIENEYLRIEFNSNGTFDMTDKESNRVFRNMNYFEDRGEHGDYWVNNRPMHNQVHSSLGCVARIWSEESGPLCASICSEVAMMIPQNGIKCEQRRGDKIEPLIIKTKVTLKAGKPHAEVQIDFENRHEDHVLRVMLPSGLSQANYVDAGGHFNVDRRPIRPQGPDNDTVWPDMGTLPQNNFVDVSDGDFGLAVLNDSLMEYEVLDNSERTIALTLLRAVHNIFCREIRVNLEIPSEKGGQCLGKHSIRFALYPHRGNWKSTEIPCEAMMFNVPVRLVQTRRHDGTMFGTEMSLFEIGNKNLIFSALKRSEDRDSYILRLYNATDEVQSSLLRLMRPLKEAWLTNLDEQRLEKLQIEHDGTIRLIASPKKIMSIECVI
jgi:mannosylglycerate hydrolase